MKRTRTWKIVCALSLAILGAAGFAMRWWQQRERADALLPEREDVEALPPPHQAVASASAPGASPSVEPRRGEGGDPDHPGRDAGTPTEIPPKGWWQIAKRVFSGISEDRILAGVTFYALLAIFPTLAALVSLYGLVADPRTISDNLSAVSGVMPGGGMQILQEQVKSLTSGPHKGLGFGAVVGLLTSLWSANAGMKALFDALNVVYEEKEKRSFVRLTLLTLAFTLGAIVFVILAMSGVVVLPAVLGFLGLGQTTKLLLDLLRWPALIIVLTVFLAAVYRYGPSRLQPRWRWVSWGGGVATLCWLLVSLAFSYYVSHFGNYNKTYGSLGAAVGFMTWIWLSSTVVLIGAELNAEMEHQTARDSTVGPEKPLGKRDALKANEVAAS
jgi:membrane protein